jgi:hypothetical protein
MRLRTSLISIVGFVVAMAATNAAPAADWSFRVQFPESVHNEPYTGRVYVFFSKEGEPRTAMNWFHPQPIVAKEVNQLAPGAAVDLMLPANDGVITYPQELAGDALEGLTAQAVIRFNTWEREVGSGSGNGFSKPVALPQKAGVVEFKVDQLVPEPVFPETPTLKLFRVRSALLSDFYQRDVYVQGGVALPRSYGQEPDRMYPVIYEIPGFGGTLQQSRKAPPQDEAGKVVDFLYVTLDPNCPLGHHVFADSANNGPWGKALTEEFIPALEKEFRAVPSPAARFLTGHSSGGWSSLWLQVAYPDFFGGVWSTAPDPVDFRDFQRIDLYQRGENMYRDRDGERRPIARVGERPVLWYDDFCRVEDVLGPGGQLHSFEAVFSPRGSDGKPMLLWNRDTGVIDTEVAETWRAYDIRLILERNWPALEEKLRGKLHVFMGGMDTFYLNGATELLKEALLKLKSGAVVEIHPGKDHGSLMTKELRTRIFREMSERYSKAKADGGTR